MPPITVQEPSLRIACVHTQRDLANDVASAMNLIRFVRMSEALERRGHEVHLAIRASNGGVTFAPGLTTQPLDEMRWDTYDVVKTFFHSGFSALAARGGADHPFIVSNLGSVVGSEDTEGVYFYGDVRRTLWATQQAIAAKSRVVSLLTAPNLALWLRMHGNGRAILEVPCGVDAEVPPPGENPYRRLGITEPVALFAGNIYSRDTQPQVNLLWQERLNGLGYALARRGIRLVAMGPGATDYLEPAAVTHVGLIDYRELWDWQWHAAVGVVLAQGTVQDNESSKIYYYLRTGLPVACEAPVPNAWIVTETGHGAVVPFDADDLATFADAVAQLAGSPPVVNGVVPYMIEKHSWDARAASYASALAAAAGRT